MANSGTTLASRDSATFIETNATPRLIDANAVMRAALPHPAATLQTRVALAEARLHVRAPSHSFDAMDLAVILVDATGRIIFVNGRAETFLSRDNCLTADGIHIGGAGTPVLRRLRQAIAQCAGSAVPQSAVTPVEIAAVEGGAALRVTFAPLGHNANHLRDAHAGHAESVALLLIRDPAQQRDAMRARLCARFGLTTAEAGVVMEVIRGGGRIDVARRLGVSVATVHTHLIRIFEKTGVRRQAELVRLALNSDSQLE